MDRRQNPRSRKPYPTAQELEARNPKKNIMITVMIVTIVTEVSKKSNDSKLVDIGLIVSTVFMIVNQIPKGLRTQII